MPERNALPDRPDQFERELDARLKSWRASAPPPLLKSRIAAEIRGPVRHYGTAPMGWREALVAGACLVVVCLLLLNVTLQPRPAIAEVEKAMQAVRYLSFRSQSDHPRPDGSVERHITETWLRRTPPASAQRVSVEVTEKGSGQKRRQVLLRRVRDGNRHISLDERTGAYKVTPRPPHQDWTRDIEMAFYAVTHPGTDHPFLAANIQQDSSESVSPWQSEDTVMNGKRVWLFRQTYTRKGFKNDWGRKDMIVTALVWADAVTHRVIRRETILKFGDGGEPVRLVYSDFRYDETPPPGTFDLKPPKKGTAKKAK